MAKTGNSFYIQLTRELFREPHCKMSQNAKWLYVVLKELEQRFCGEDDDKQNHNYKKKDYFYRSDKELCEDSGMSITTLKKAKSELKKSGLIIFGKVHWIIDPTTRKLSKKHVTSYKIL